MLGKRDMYDFLRFFFFFLSFFFFLKLDLRNRDKTKSLSASMDATMLSPEWGSGAHSTLQYLKACWMDFLLPPKSPHSIRDFFWLSHLSLKFFLFSYDFSPTLYPFWHIPKYFFLVFPFRLLKFLVLSVNSFSWMTL